jgi:hypothetical protein
MFWSSYPLVQARPRSRPERISYYRPGSRNSQPLLSPSCLRPPFHNLSQIYWRPDRLRVNPHLTLNLTPRKRKSEARRMQLRTPLQQQRWLITAKVGDRPKNRRASINARARVGGITTRRAKGRSDSTIHTRNIGTTGFCNTLRDNGSVNTLTRRRNNVTLQHY